MLIGFVGEGGAFVKVEVSMVGLVADVSTFSGASAVAFGSTEGLMIPIVAVDTVGAEFCWDTSGWIPTE